MRAVWARLRAEARTGWGPWLGIAILIGTTGGAAMASAAGARRTDSALPRFVDQANVFDVSTAGGQNTEEVIRRDQKVIAAAPMVSDHALMITPALEIRTEDDRALGVFDLAAFLDPTGRVGVEVEKVKLLQGRRVDPAAGDEATISIVADGHAIGDTLTLRIPTAPGSEEVFDAPVTIVGVHVAIGDLQAVGGRSVPSLLLSPGFYTRYRQTIDRLVAGEPSSYTSLNVRLRRGEADLPAFREYLREHRVETEIPISTGDHVRGVRSSIRFVVLSLWTLAVLLTLGTAVFGGQALARLTGQDIDELTRLRAIGMSPRQLTAIGRVRSALIGSVGAGIGIGVAVALSPLTPIGPARLIEPEEGVAIDAAVLGAGALLTVAICVIAVLWPTRRSARLTRSPLVAGGSRPSRVVEALMRAGVSVPIVSGVRMALDPGRGPSAVPVRQAITGVALAAGGLVMAVTFATSLHHLVHTPEQTGSIFDALVFADDSALPRLRSSPDVAAVDHGGPASVQIGRRSLLALAFEPGGPFAPSMIAGRAPLTADEIALGPKTMRDNHRSIGEQITVEVGSSIFGGGTRVERPMRIVGIAAIPDLFFQLHEPGDGAVMTLAAVPATPDAPPALLVRFRSDDLDDSIARMRASVPEGIAFVVKRIDQAQVSTLTSIERIPLVLSAALVVLGMGTMIHAVASAVRRRRRELAVLKTLGFERSQVRATMRWQATAIALVGLGTGVPAGIAAARWGWRAFADQLGVVPTVVLPAAAPAAIVGGVVLVAQIVAALPARAAAETQPAAVFRSE